MPINPALQRIQSRPPIEPMAAAATEPILPTLEEEIAAVETKDDGGMSLANTGALQGPLQGDESKGGAMSSPGVRPAVQSVQKKKPTVEKKSTPAKPAVKKSMVAQSKETYITPKRPNLFQRNRVGVVVTKGTDGKRLLMMITTNSYYDREREAIATKALDRYVSRAWDRVEDKCLPDNTLRFWHNGDIGDMVYADMEGPFLLEVAKERPNKLINLARPGQKPFMVMIKNVWDYLEDNPDNLEWGASHGFKFFKGQRTKSGVYQNIYKFESSVLPLRWAANPYTFSGVVDMEPRDKLLQQLVGRANAKALRQGARQLKKALDVRGVAHKERKPSKAAKGLLEDLEEKFGVMVGDLTDDATKQDALKQQLMEAVVECLSAGEASEDMNAPAPEGTDADHEAGYQYNEVDEESVDEEEKEDEEAAEGEPVMSGKALRLMDVLIESQDSIVKSLNILTERQKELEGVAKLPASFSALDKRLKSIESQLRGRPQAASESDDTVEDDPDFLSKVQKAMATFDPFWNSHVEGE